MELKYITQENIDDSHVNITSAEIYKEFQEYNGLMLRMQKKRYKFLFDYWLLWGMNAVLVPLIMYVPLIPKFSTILHMDSTSVLPYLLILLASMILLVLVVGIRRNYSWKLGFIITAIMLPVSPFYIFLAIANAAVIYIMEKTDSEMRYETGYPHFVQLSGSYKSFVKEGEVFGIENEGIYATSLKSDNVVPEDPFAKYRIRPEDDMGMLADNDINNDKE